MPVSKKPRKPYQGNRHVLTSRECGRLQKQLDLLAHIVRQQGRVILAIHEKIMGRDDPTAIQIATELPHASE